MPELKRYRCGACNYPIFYGDIQKGIVSKDCSRCKTRNIITADAGRESQTIITVKPVKVYTARP